MLSKAIYNVTLVLEAKLQCFAAKTQNVSFGANNQIGGSRDIYHGAVDQSQHNTTIGKTYNKNK